MLRTAIRAVAVQQNAVSFAGFEGTLMRKPHVLAFAIGVIVACSSPTSGCGCSPPPQARVLVFGTVRTASESPVSGARISLRGVLGPCSVGGQITIRAEAAMPSDSAGNYRFPLAPAASGLDSVCVQLVARRSSMANADTIVSAAAALGVRYDRQPDSTRIDFRFP